MPQCQLTLSQIRSSHPNQLSDLALWEAWDVLRCKCAALHTDIQRADEKHVFFLQHILLSYCEVLADAPTGITNGHHILVQGNGFLPSGGFVLMRRGEEERGGRGHTQNRAPWGHPHRNHMDTSKQLNSYILVQLITFTLALTTKQYMFIVKNQKIRKGHKDEIKIA